MIGRKNEMDALREKLASGSFVNEDGSEITSSNENLKIESEADFDEVAIAGFLDDFQSGPAKEYRIMVPSSFAENPYNAYLYGIARNDTGVYYIIEVNEQQVDSQFALIGTVGACADGMDVYGSIKEGKLYFSTVEDSISLRIEKYDTVTKLFSRNTGLLESSWMLSKWAVIVGCGSVGSLVAMELARSGVGNFVLIDTDKLEMHNICRHQCGFDDLGRYKVDAVKDKVKNINPWANVITYTSIIQDIPEEELHQYLGKDSIIIGCGDNRGSSNWSCNLAIKTRSAFLTTSCWTRAYAGEIFYWVPEKNWPCYNCALGKISSTDRPESHATYFGEEEDMNNLAFEPGVSVDIDFVTTIALKLCLDIINRHNQEYTPRVINYLTQYTLVCNTNEPKIGGKMARIFSYPLQVTHNLYFEKKTDCPYCNSEK